MTLIPRAALRRLLHQEQDEEQPSSEQPIVVPMRYLEAADSREPWWVTE